MLARSLLERLADARPAPLADLAAALGLAPPELEQALAALGAAGLGIERRGDGTVRLAEPIHWLTPAAVESAIREPARRCIERVECVFELESTNRALLAAGAPAPGRMRVLLAEYQHGGRGRRGRRWIMPPGAGIALSAAWRFAERPAALTALGLAVGAAARRALGDAVGLEAGLKWPNDLVVDHGKLGGVLVELETLAAGGCHAVAGIGLNVRAPAGFLAGVSDFRHGARDLASAVPGVTLDRAAIAGALVTRLAELFAGFAETGFEPYRAEWLAAHVLEGEAVELATPTGVASGTVRGIGADGALLVEDVAGEQRRVLSADVTVRVSA